MILRNCTKEIGLMRSGHFGIFPLDRNSKEGSIECA